MFRNIIPIFFFLMLSSSAFTEINPESRFMVGANADTNFMFVESTDANTKYGAALQFGYGLTKNNMIIVGFEYQKRQFLPLNKNDIYADESVYHQNYIDMNLIHRYLWELFYLDAGLYYGRRIGKMSGGENGTVQDKYAHDDIGVVIGFGLLFQLNDNLAIDLSLVDKIGVTPIFNVPGYTEVRTVSQVLNIGCVKFF